MAQVQFYRTTSNHLEDIVENDGRLIVTTDTKKLYLDNGNDRIQIEGPDIEMTKTTEKLGEGSIITDGAGFAEIKKIYGDTQQDSIPTPDSPQQIKVVTGEQAIQINGKNLFDKNNVNKINGTISWKSGKINNPDSGNIIFYIPILPNTTYTISKILGSNFKGGFTDSIPTIGDYCDPHSENETDNKNFTITSGNNSKYLVVEYYSSSSSLTEQQVLDSIQVEQNSVATPYEAYKTPKNKILNLGSLELCKIGNYQDYIYKNKNDGNWYKHSKIGKYVYNNDINGSAYVSSGIYECTTPPQNVEGSLKESQFGEMSYCNILPSTRINGNGLYGTQYSGAIRFSIKGDPGDYLSDIKRKFLKDSNFTIYFVLKTEEDILITDANLIRQLEKAFYLFDKTNGFSITTNNAKLEFDMLYASSTLDVYSKEETNYLLNNKLEYFNTLNDLRNGDPKIGDCVITFGYYTKGDCGGSKYSIRAAASGETDNGGSIIVLNNGLVAELIVENDKLHVMQFGIQQETDITSKLNTLASYIATNHIGNIEFATDGVYELSGAVVFNTDTLTIYGNNSSLKVQDGIYRALRVYGDTINIYNLTIDGNDTRQNQWEDTRYPGNMTNIYALSTDCRNVNLQNFNIYNLWGQGMMLLNYNEVNIENCIFNKIGGGFYYTDPETGANDNFGDALHFGGHNGVANITLNNFYAEGYTTTIDGGHKSRGGLVLEDFIGTTYTPTNTYVTMNNCQLINFNRVFHYEGPMGPATIKFTNGKIIQDASICVPEYNCNLIIENSEINHTELNYGGSNSFRGYNALIKNSIVNLANGAQNSLVHASKCEYQDCIINNINNISFTNGTGLFKNCTLNFNGLATYWLYNSTSDFYNCVFNNSSTSSDLAMTEGGSKFNIHSCIFNNIKPYGNFKDINSKIYLASSIGTTAIGNYSKATIYVNNALLTKPNINRIFDATNEINFDSVYTMQTFGENTSINLFPSTLPTDFKWKPNSKYLMIIYGANADYLRFDLTFDSACYFATVLTNSNGTPSILGTIEVSPNAPSGYNRELSFNLVNNTISKGTASSNVNRVMWWLLPYNYYKEVANMNNKVYQTKQMIVTYSDSTTETINLVVSN